MGAQNRDFGPVSRRTEPGVSFVCGIDLDYDAGHSELKNPSNS